MGHPRPGVFLDRDGVLNDVIVRAGKSYPPSSAETLEVFPEVAPALHSLRAAGLPIVVVTNQPDVGAGTQTRAAVDAIHARLLRQLPIDAIEVCFHTDQDGCDCRKPAPGMLRAAAERLGIDLERSFLVGDRWRDIEAGQRVGCTTFWIDRGYRERAPESPDHVVAHVGAAARIILVQLGRTNAPVEHRPDTEGEITCDAS